MNFSDFWSSPDTSHKIYFLNGKEPFYKYLIKNLLVKALKDHEFVFVTTDLESEEFYEKTESADLIPHPKLFYIDNSSGDLSSHKYFWEGVQNSGPESRYIISDPGKGVPKEVRAFEIECDGVKDNPRDVGKFVTEYSKKLGLFIEPKNIPVFHYLYKNNLFAIYTELRKCKIWSEETGKVEVDYTALKHLLSPSAEKDTFQLSTNFLHRRLKPTLNDIADTSEHDILLHVFNVFKGAEKVLVYKSARAAGISDVDISSEFEINIHYLNFTVKPLEKLWGVDELKNLLLDLESLNFKSKSSSFPATQGLVHATMKYCR